MIKSYGLSDIGISRSNNEDVWIAIPEMGFFALADGMGGHKAGEIAARETIDKLSESVKQIEASDPVEWIMKLRHAIEKTNHWIYRLSQENEAHNGMGTTLCCLISCPNAVIYAHVGDSRIYRLRNKKLQLLTEDHSLFTKWLNYGKLAEVGDTPYPYKNVITRAIGTSAKANPEIAVSITLPGDIFFLCSDGLSDVLTLEEMEKNINRSSNLEVACKDLIEKAKNKGSSDNITILMVQFEQGNAEDLFRQQFDDIARPKGFQSDASGFNGPSL